MLMFEDTFNQAACVKSGPPEQISSASDFSKGLKSNQEKY